MMPVGKLRGCLLLFKNWKQSKKDGFTEMKLNEIIFLEMIKELVPEKVQFRSKDGCEIIGELGKGGLQDGCEIIGELGDILEFLRKIHTDGFSSGLNTAFRYVKEKRENEEELK